MQQDKVPAASDLPAPPPRPAGRARSRLWVVALAGLALSGGGAAVWWQPWVPKPTVVAVETLALAPASRVLAVNGQVAALVSVPVRSAVSGTLTDLRADEGDAVVAGDVLARLDATQQEAVVRQANAALEEGRVALAQAAATFGRTRDLGAVVARTRLEDAQRGLDSATQEVDRLRAMLDQAQIVLSRYTITAPISGTVIDRTVDPGQLVDVSTPLFIVADLTGLVVETTVDEAYATQIRPGLTAALQLVGTSGVLPGRITFVSPRVDPATGGLAVRIAFDTPQDAPVGLTVTANIVVEDHPAALTVPRTALVAGTGVLVVDQGVARLRPVQVIDWPAARLIVTGGLASGDVVIADATGVSDGQAVKAAP